MPLALENMTAPAGSGMIVSLFDVTKAFNNLRRCDIKDAVDNSANPPKHGQV
jgi:hypothetical protein